MQCGNFGESVIYFLDIYGLLTGRSISNYDNPESLQGEISDDRNIIWVD